MLKCLKSERARRVHDHNKRGPERRLKHWTPDKLLINAVHAHISGDSSFQRPLPKGRVDKTAPCLTPSRLHSFSVLCPDVPNPEALPYTLLLHPRDMTQSSVLHPGIVCRVKDKTKSRECLNTDMNIKQECFLLSLLCLATFTMRKTWMGMIWHSHFTVQQQCTRRQNLALLGCDTALIVSDILNWKKTPENTALPQSPKSHHVGLIGVSVKCNAACTQPLCASWSCTKAGQTTGGLHNLALKPEVGPWPFPI